MATKICNTSLPKNGNPCCSDRNNFGSIVSLFFTTSDFEFSSFANFASQSQWLSGIASGDIIPINDVVESEDQSEETKYYDSPLGVRLKLRDGKYGNVYRFQVPFTVHKKLQGLSNQNVKMFKADINGNVYGTSDDDTTVQGFSISMVNVEKMKFGTPESPAWTVINVREDDPAEWNTSGQTVAPDWGVNSLDGLTDIVLGYVSKSGAYLNVSGYAICGLDENGAINQIPITGLSLANFTDTGNTITGITDNLDGTYVLEGDIDWGTGMTVQVDATGTNLYESNIITLT